MKSKKLLCLLLLLAATGECEGTGGQKGGTGKHDDVLERVGAGHVYLQGERR